MNPASALPRARRLLFLGEFLFSSLSQRVWKPLTCQVVPRPSSAPRPPLPGHGLWGGSIFIVSGGQRRGVSGSLPGRVWAGSPTPPPCSTRHPVHHFILTTTR